VEVTNYYVGVVIIRSVMFEIKNKQYNTNVTATILSCGRFDLLQRTIESFLKTAGTGVNVILYDDSANEEHQQLIFNEYSSKFDLYLGDERKGQAWGIDFLFSKAETPWIFYLEDDWLFLEPGYLQDSARVLTADPSIMICGIAIKQSYFSLGAATNLHEVSGVRVYDHSRWRISEHHGWWNGWIGSPNLKRTDDIRKLPKFSSVFDEEEWDREVFGKSGRRSVWLEKRYVEHIGYGRSLFPPGDMIRRNWGKPK
jgi:hypothetical protein